MNRLLSHGFLAAFLMLSVGVPLRAREGVIAAAETDEKTSRRSGRATEDFGIPQVAFINEQRLFLRNCLRNCILYSC